MPSPVPEIAAEFLIRGVTMSAMSSADERASSLGRVIKVVARTALGFVWVYQGVVPKLFGAAPLEHDIVERTGLYLVSTTFSMRLIGVFEVGLGIWLLSGWRERWAAATTTGFMLVLAVVVVIEEPALLVGPFGGIVKNVALVACGWIVWRLAADEKG